jgi:hypothetical protein
MRTATKKSVHIVVTLFCLIAVVNGLLPTASIRVLPTNADLPAAATRGFGAPLPNILALAPALRLVAAQNYSDTCVANTNGAGSALLVSRGMCPFDVMLQVAETAGYSAIVVANTLKGMYAGQQTVSEDAVDCSQGELTVTKKEKSSPPWNIENEGTCTYNPGCLSTLCAFTADTKMCCIWDWYVPMGANNSSPPPPQIGNGTVAVFVTIADGNRLAELMQDHVVKVQIFEEIERGHFAPGVLAIWFLAVATVLVASYTAAHSAHEENKWNDEPAWVDGRDFSEASSFDRVGNSDPYKPHKYTSLAEAARQQAAGRRANIAPCMLYEIGLDDKTNVPQDSSFSFSFDGDSSGGGNSGLDDFGLSHALGLFLVMSCALVGFSYLSKVSHLVCLVGFCICGTVALFITILRPIFVACSGCLRMHDIKLPAITFNNSGLRKGLSVCFLEVGSPYE